MTSSARRWTALRVSLLAVASALVAAPSSPATLAAVEARSRTGPSLCADCTPAPLPCPPCFACVQTDPEGRPGRPTPECPLPRSSAA